MAATHDGGDTGCGVVTPQRGRCGGIGGAADDDAYVDSVSGGAHEGRDGSLGDLCVSGGGREDGVESDGLRVLR